MRVQLQGAEETLSGVDDCVEQLATAVGVAVARLVRYDWAAVEASLGGLRLPTDYKDLVETFPTGRFQRFASVIRPGEKGHAENEYLGYYRHRLEDMRSAREDENDPATFPYPIFPEEGGLLPWGDGPRGELFFWLTRAKDPSDWSVVVADQTWTDWNELPGTMCYVLNEMVSNRLIRNPYADTTSGPLFEPGKPRPSTPVPPPAWLSSRRPLGERPRDQLDDLAPVMPKPTWRVDAPDWRSVERKLGLRLPSDYKHFLETYGPGTFCDITIFGVDSCGLLDVFGLLMRNMELARENLRPPYSIMKPFYPEPGGIVSWGETSEGRVCGWGPGGDNPDDWGVVVVAPFPKARTMAYFQDVSFSTFLVRYSGLDGNQSFLASPTPWEGPISFTPHRHNDT